MDSYKDYVAEQNHHLVEKGANMLLKVSDILSVNLFYPIF
jgi:hypothetical protein